MHKLPILLLLLLPFVAPAAERVKPELKEVTVYLSGAKLSSEATVTLGAGAREVVFEGLPANFNPNSLQVRLRGAALLLSAQMRYVAPEPPKDSPLLPLLQDSLTLFDDLIGEVAYERQVLTNEEGLINNTQARIGAGEHKVLSVKDLQDLAAFYNARLMEIKKRQHDLNLRERELRKLRGGVQARLEKLRPNEGKPSGEIALTLDVERAGAVEIACTYWVGEAGWTPLYDLRSAGFGQPLNLVYKASIVQNTGLEWKNVRLKLSTANPLLNNSRPILNPWYVDFVVTRPPVVTRDQDKVYAESNLAQIPSLPTDELNLAAPGAPEPFEPAEEEEKPPLNFELPRPQTVPSDGQNHLVLLEEITLKGVSYEYYAVPKLQPAVFLLAKVTDYGQYNLAAGNASIFFEDTYIGESLIDPSTVADTLLLSLGQDDDIRIKRNKPEDVKGKALRISGEQKKERITYEIQIKNNKRVAIPIEILDQVPVSRNAALKVNVDEDELGGALYNPDYGKLTWKLTVPPGENKKVRFSYELVYPKDKVIR